MANIVVYASSSVAMMKTKLLIDSLMGIGHDVTALISKSADENVVDLNFDVTHLNKKFSIKKDVEKYPAEHIQLAKKTDLVIVAPASLNFLSKYANGISDEINLAMLYAYDGPVLIAPAMNDIMWKNLNKRHIIERIESLGNHYLIGPEKGSLYEGYDGTGRMSEIDDIIDNVKNILSKRSYPKIIISYGASKRHIDQVRYITNGATGTFAMEIKRELLKQGFIADLVDVGQYNNEALVKIISEYDIYIASAAIANFKGEVNEEKIKTADEVTIKLFKDLNVIDELAKINPALKIMAFKYDNDIEAAKKRFNSIDNIKGLCWNKIGAMGNEKINGGVFTNHGMIPFSNATKREVAAILVEEMKSWL